MVQFHCEETLKSLIITFIPLQQIGVAHRKYNFDSNIDDLRKRFDMFDKFV